MSEICEITGARLANKKINFQWEEIDRSSGDFSRTYRAKVFGGWIVNSWCHNNSGVCESMVFVPDKNHEWEIA